VCFYPSNANSIIGISLDVLDPKRLPINGLRYHPENNANGWVVWRGAEPLSKDDDYFKSMHVEYLF